MPRDTSLRGQLVRLIATSILSSLALFAAITFAVIVLEDALDVDAIPELDDDPAFLLAAFAVAAALSLAILLPLAAWLSRRALAPLEAVIEAAHEMGVEHLDRRLEVPDGPDELRELAEALNGQWARLEVGFEALERFAADASHELRTPLAVARSELEVTRRRERTVAEWEEAADRALAALGGLGRLVEALLELARGGEGAARQTVELGELCDEVCAVLAPRAAAAEVELGVALDDPAAVWAEPATLSTALSALVANAIRYTPAGGRVEVRVAGAAVHVDDSGPGVDDAERARIFEPLARGAAGRAADHRGGEAGLGLGLAIARRIARHHGAELELSDSPLGGARFSLVWAAGQSDSDG